MNRSGNASRPRNQVAIAVSYAAVVAKASAASRRRVSAESRPSFAAPRGSRRSASASRPARRGRSSSRPREHRRPADVDHLDRVHLGHAVARRDLREGQKPTQTRSIGSIPWSSSAARSSGWSRAPGSPRGFEGEASSRGRRASPGSRSAPPPASRGSRSPRDARRAAACDEVDAEVLETLRELDQPRLVPGGQEGAADHSIRPRTVSGRRRCSTAWTRARSVSTVSPSCTGTGSATITAPVSTPSST